MNEFIHNLAYSAANVFGLVAAIGALMGMIVWQAFTFAEWMDGEDDEGCPTITKRIVVALICIAISVVGSSLVKTVNSAASSQPIQPVEGRP